MQSEPTTLLVSAPTLAALCDGISVRRVQQLADDGVLPRVGHGQYDAMLCVPAFLRHKLAEVAEKAARTPAEDRVRDLRADDLAMRMEERSGALIAEAREEALAIVDEFAGPLRSGILSVPARHVKDLVLRRKLEEALEAEFGAAAKAAGAMASDTSPQPSNRAARRAARARSKR